MEHISDQRFDDAADTLIGSLPAPIDFKSAYDQLKPTERVFVDAFIASDDALYAIRQARADVNARIEAKQPHCYSFASARATEYSRRPLIQAAVAERLSALAARYELTADRLLSELAKIAYSNMEDYASVNADGDMMLKLGTATRDQMAAVSEITVEEVSEGRGEAKRTVRKTKFKLHAKLTAIDMGMKRLGLYDPDKTEISGPGGSPIQTNNVNANVPAPFDGITLDMTPGEAANRYALALQQAREDEEL